MKKRPLICIVAVLLCLLLLIPALPLTSVAKEAILPDTSAARAATFYHIESGSTLLSQCADDPLPAGSTVKLMSGLLFCELLADRRTEVVVITKEMVNGSTTNSLKLSVGDRLRVEDLLYAAICGSYNDAFHILTYIAAQSPERFIALMNERAVELGLQGTTFTDPIGTADTSITTANDLQKIAVTAYQNSLYMQLCSAKSYHITALSIKIKNKNEMINGNLAAYTHINDKCNGMSVGNTDLGGDCIIASATNGTDSYICVLLNCGSSPLDDQKNNQSYVLANRLIDWVYKTYTYMEVLPPETVICTLPVTVSDMTNEINVVSRDSISAYLPSTAEIGKEITYSIRLTNTSLEAPVEVGKQVGYVAVLYQGEILGTVPLYTAGSAERSGFVSRLMSIQSLIQNRRFLSGAIFFLVILTVWIAAEVIFLRQRRRRWNKYFSNRLDTSNRNPPKRK